MLSSAPTIMASSQSEPPLEERHNTARCATGTSSRIEDLERVVQQLKAEKRQMARAYNDHVRRLEAAQAQQAAEHRDQIERLLECRDPVRPNPFVHGDSKAPSALSSVETVCDPDVTAGDRYKLLHQKFDFDSDSEGTVSPTVDAPAETKLFEVVERLQSQLGVLERVITLEKAAGKSSVPSKPHT